MARLAGVSRGTVSLVLNRQNSHVPISRATRDKVTAAARQLGYSPNPIAQMLASGRNRIIGFFAFEGTFPYGQEDFHHPYLVGVEHEACVRDFDLLLFTRQDQPPHALLGSCYGINARQQARVYRSRPNRVEALPRQRPALRRRSAGAAGCS